MLTSQSQAIQSLRVPVTKKEFRELLVTIGYCQLWIPNFAAITKHLLEALRERNTPSLE